MKKPSRSVRTNKSSAVLPMTAEDLRDVDLPVVREQITNLVGRRALEMVGKTIAEVCDGHYPAMKYLFELAGLRPKIAGEEVPEEDSLAKTLLLRLQALQPTVVPKEGEPSLEGPEQDRRTVK